MNVAYIRCSSTSQHTDRQIEGLKQHYQIDKIFEEKVSGASTKGRVQLEAMLDYVREGDYVYVWELSRLGRSLIDLVTIINRLESKGVKFVSHKENIDTSSATGRLMLNLLGSISQFERECLKERQAEGIAIAKAKGKFKGRKEVNIKDFDTHYARYKSREVNKSQLANELNISRPTLDKLLKEHERKNIHSIKSNC